MRAVMTPAEIAIKCSVVGTVIDSVPGARRVGAIADAMKQRPPKRDQGEPEAEPENVNEDFISHLRSDTHRGVRPETLYEFGEAAHAAGVPWCSGMLMLSLVPPHGPHAWGIFGSLLRLARERKVWENIYGMWAGLQAALAEKPKDLIERGEPLDYCKALAFSKPQRDLLRSAWEIWFEDEDAADFPDIVRAYLAVAAAGVGSRENALTTNVRVSIEYLMAFRFVEREALAWVRRYDEEWWHVRPGDVEVDIDVALTSSPMTAAELRTRMQQYAEMRGEDEDLTLYEAFPQLRPERERGLDDVL